MIDKLQTAASWFFICFGVTMVGVSILVVPPNAFAQEPGSCGSNCCVACGGPTDCQNLNAGSDAYKCWNQCKIDCENCVLNCGGDSSCQAKCKGNSLWLSGPCPNDPVTICQFPGLRCFQGTTPSTCGPSINKSQCTCL